MALHQPHEEPRDLAQPENGRGIGQIPTSRRKRHHLQKDIATALQTAPTTGASQQCGMCFIGQLCILYMYLCSHVYMTYVLVHVGFRFICHNVVVTHFFLTIQMPRRSSSICPGSESVGSTSTCHGNPLGISEKKGKKNCEWKSIKGIPYMCVCKYMYVYK